MYVKKNDQKLFKQNSSGTKSLKEAKLLRLVEDGKAGPVHQNHPISLGFS